MDKAITFFVGLDVHKESIAIGVAATGNDVPRFVGTVGPALSELLTALSRLGPHPAQDLAFAEYRQAVSAADAQVTRLTAALRTQVETWRMQPVVAALSTLRGIDFVAAVTLLAELGDLTRFAHPRELMGFLGLVPAQYSSGETRRHGAITRTGNGHARRVLVEAALNHRFPARMSRRLQQRQTGQPAAVSAIAWKAQIRLCHRYRHLAARGLPQNKASVAIARELAGFVWDIARQVQPTL